MDIRQTPEHAKYLQRVGWVVETVRPYIQVYLRRIPLLPFHVMKIQRYTKEPNVSDILALKKKYRVKYMVTEPSIGLMESATDKRLRLKRSSSGFLCTKTLQIDLSKSVKQLQGELHQNAKRQLKKSSVQTVVLKTIAEKNLFQQHGQKFGKFWMLNDKQFDALLDGYGLKARCIASIDPATHEQVSGIILLCSNDTVYYYRAWTSPLGKELGAHYASTWFTIQFAKKQGFKWFDFDGIFDERFPVKTWQGFTEFKRKFGGVEIEYPGCYERFSLL